MAYYIEYDGGNDGPFDLLGIIRKVRNGSLQKHHLVSRDDDIRPKPAYQHPDLYDVFIEQDKVDQEQDNIPADQNISFVGLIKSGISVLKEDQTAAVLTGIFLIILFFLVGISTMTLPVLVAGLIVPILAFMCFEVCLIAILRLSRVQMLSFRYITEIIRTHGISLLVAALPAALVAFTIPWLLSDIIGKGAWGLMVIAGFPVIAYFFYVPLLVADRNMGIREAFAINNKVMRSIGLELYLLILGLLLINVVAAAFIILPLLTLPITLLGLMTLYDHYFNEY
jgi:hypothetical protein